jgi:hypothetical protein
MKIRQFTGHKDREIAGPKEIPFVSTLLTHGLQAGIVEQRGFEQSESDCKKMGEQRRCQTSHFGNESNTA